MHELERGGAARAEVLRRRADLGMLAPERLRGAAVLGDLDALEATSGEGAIVDARAAFCADHAALERWAPALAALDDEALRRVVVVAFGAWVDALADTPWPAGATRDVVVPTCREAAATYRRFVGAPGEPARLEVAAVAERAARLRWSWRLSRLVAPARVLVSEAGYLLATKALRDDGRARVARLVVRADVPPPGTSQRAAKRAGIGAGRVRNTLRDALVEWLLA